jgi:hypothetical protein
MVDISYTDGTVIKIVEFFSTKWFSTTAVREEDVYVFKVNKD